MHQTLNYMHIYINANSCSYAIPEVFSCTIPYSLLFSLAVTNLVSSDEMSTAITGRSCVLCSEAAIMSRVARTLERP